MESAEDKLISRFFKPLATHPGALSLTDDAAFLAPPPGHDLVLKTDAIVGGVHFFHEDAPGAVARKALRVNLSDLAAKGARPLGFLLTLAIPASVDDEWLQHFSDGLKADSETFDCPLFGGDTDRTPGPATIAVFVLGAVPTGGMVRRAGARPGDRVVVTGTIGDAALGLKLRHDVKLAQGWNLDAAQRAHLCERYLLPQPRLAVGEALRANASAAMDVSDGLVGDLTKLCRVSGVSAQIDATKIPLSPAGQSALLADPALIEPILTGGDDYEVLCTMPADRFMSFKAAADAFSLRVSDLGAVVEGEGPPIFRDGSGKALSFTRGSFSHF